MKNSILNITFFLLLPIFSLAQNESWENLNKKTEEYYYQGNYTKALEYAILSEKQALKKFGANDSAYFVSLNNLGVVNFTLGNYTKAKNYYVQVKNLREKKFGKEHPDYSLSINNLATYYWQMREFPKAEKLYIEAMEIRARVVGTHDPTYAKSVNDLAGLYADIGKYKEAEDLYLKSKKIFENSKGKESYVYGECLNNLAQLYIYMGRYSEADFLLNKTLEIYKNTLGKDNLNYIIAINTIASLYLIIENSQKAEVILEEQKEQIEKLIGKEHPIYIDVLNKLAGIQLNNKNFALAKELINKSIELTEKIGNINTSDYAKQLLNLSTIYDDKKNYDKSLSFTIQAKDIFEKTVTKKSLSYARACISLAYTYSKMDKIEKANALYIEAKEILEQTLGVHQQDYSDVIELLAQNYQRQANNTKAEEYYVEANTLSKQQIIQNFSFMNEQEKNILIDRTRVSFDKFQSFALNYKHEKPEFTAYCYNNELALKGIVLQNEISLRQAIFNSKDSSLQHNYNELNSLKNYLRKLYVNNEEKKIIEPFEQQAEALEKKITRKTNKLPEFAALTSKKNTDWQSIQKALKPDEIAIEYTTFQYRNADRWTDSIYYCALILRKDYKYPKMVYLFEKEDLLKVLKDTTNNFNSVDELYAARAIIKLVNTNTEALNEQLYKLIWQPIESELKGIKELYIAPSGILHTISFAALSIGDSNYLSDKYHVNIVSSTSNILNKTKFKAPKSIVLYGGINYNVDTMVMENNSKTDKVLNNLLVSRDVSEIENTENWNYLRGTKSEIDIIAKLFKKKKRKNIIYSNELANEESFKALSGKKIDVIHLATHGFYFNLNQQSSEDLNYREILANKNAFKNSKNPLLRSGLILAGANRAWNKKTIPKNVEDGILTAYEVSQMNLFGTKLVTLSACQTGLGDIYIGRGVVGLQQAFKMAGVNYLIVALWSVPDKETSEFMSLFYKKWLKGSEIKKAFRDAQTSMRKKYSPYYWAGFKLIN